MVPPHRHAMLVGVLIVPLWTLEVLEPWYPTHSRDKLSTEVCNQAGQ